MKVFDASAIIAILFNEAGAQTALQSLAGAQVSTVNVAETIGDFVKRGRSSAEALSVIETLNLTFVSPDAEQARRAGEMQPIKGLSLGDRFCIALAQSVGAPVVTSDRAWAQAPIGVPVELIR